MQQNWNSVHKWNRKYSQGLGWLWIPPFTDGRFRLSHISLKKTLNWTKYTISFLFCPNALWSLSYIPIFWPRTSVSEKLLQINQQILTGLGKTRKFKKVVTVYTLRASLTREPMVSFQTPFMGDSSSLLPFCHRLRIHRKAFSQFQETHWLEQVWVQFRSGFLLYITLVGLKCPNLKRFQNESFILHWVAGIWDLLLYLLLLTQSMCLKITWKSISIRHYLAKLEELQILSNI